VSPHAASKPLAFLCLRAIFLSTGTVWCLILAAFASTLSRPLRERPAFGVALRRATGALFVGFGIRIAFSRT
jgi:threonine/homoserine/homoserine lactone efflux protein